MAFLITIIITIFSSTELEDRLQENNHSNIHK